jgi:hypothetical protein
MACVPHWHDGQFAHHAHAYPCPCAVGQITTILPRVPHPIRGAFRDRHERWARDAMDAMSHETTETIADGEIVWSRRPDAGAPRNAQCIVADVTTLSASHETVTTKPGLTGEITYKP